MKRQLPIAITFILGFVLTLQYFIPHRSFEIVYEVTNIWLQIIGFFAMILGILSLVMLHWDKIQYKKTNWGYSIVTLVSLVGITLVGVIGTEESPAFNWLYNYILAPISATMFALLAFFIASAAYRAFRARTIIATILLLAAIIVMMGRVPIGSIISFGIFPKLSDILLNYPNVAAKRAILMGVGLGAAATGLKVMLGIERSYMGSD
ncbi:MAG: hypothetical protein CO189_11955 [candidate division Zixibacteria bacterium CG_4_9_14_3_um_filter_46_8]|nr:MAG: hypothetical protein CO189_11955 [candidate division Zixibacteria bacterium CG_4_9_14_3_um_filter_46_8]